jgi:hypothetical protein
MSRITAVFLFSLVGWVYVAFLEIGIYISLRYEGFGIFLSFSTS